MVNLFKRAMTYFYLSLNQCITFFEEEYCKNRCNNATLVANYFKTQIGAALFSKNEIDITLGISKSISHFFIELYLNR